MESQIYRIGRFALFSRLLIVLLQVFFNILVPDHDAKVFATPLLKNHTSSNLLASYTLDGFTRWDSQYFLHITLYGYTYENTLAFFPLFPLIVRFVTSLPFFQCDYYCFLFIGVTLNICFFCISTVFIYKLSVIIFISKELAFVSSLLFCINPASIFFSTFYSESLFCMLTIVGLYCLENCHLKQAIVVLSLSAATRSNGVINLGFIIYYITNNFFNNAFPIKSIRNFFVSFMLHLGTVIAGLVVFLFPFAVYQAYSYFLYCTPHIKQESSLELVTNYAMVNNFKMPKDFPSDWCDRNIPLSYSYVQNHYWNVGFLQYYELKQIPNFLLALPLLIIIFVSSVKYIRNNRKLVLRLGLLPTTKSEENIFNNEKCVVYIIHALVITVFCLFFIHVQVTTRLVASSSPVLYWIVANLVNSNKKFIKSFLLSEQNIIGDCCSLYHLLQSNIYGKLCGSYFIIYFIVGTLLHVNHLPWT